MTTLVRPTGLVRDLRLLSARIAAAYGPAGQKRRGLGRRLWLELVRVLNGTGDFEQIPWSAPNTVGLTARINRRLRSRTHHALARAVYEHHFYKVGIETCMARGELHRSEWDFFSRLTRALNVSPVYGLDQLSQPPGWMVDVDEAHHEVRVWVRELALQDLLLAGMEAYLVPAGSGKPSTEVYGIVFGSLRMAPRVSGRAEFAQVDYNVERVCIQHRAKCSPSVVFADERSEAAQLAMGEELFPYWHLLGDFHTHTYRSLAELRRMGGWHYSDADQAMNIEWCEKLRTLGHRPRIALILAITRAGRRGSGTQECWNGMPHVLKTTIGRCHCFISAYRIRRDGRYTTEGLTLKCPHLAGFAAPPTARTRRVLTLAEASEAQRRRYARA